MSRIPRTPGRLSMYLVALFVLTLSFTTSAQTVIQMAVYDLDAARWQAIADRFSDTHPDIKVEVQFFPYGEYPEKITSMVAAGTPPDVFLTWAQYRPLWVKYGILEDLTSRWESSPALKAMNIYPFMLESITLDGRIYGVPYDYNSTSWFYDRDLFSERGLAEPDANWTTQDHAEMARKLTDPQRGIYGTLNPLRGAGGNLIQWMENWAGHGWIGENGTEILVDDPVSADMVQYWYDLAYQYEVLPTPGSFAPRGNQFTGGYAMWQGWVSYAFRIADTAAYDWGIALYPKAPAGQRAFAQGHMYSMSTGTNHPEEAWTFLEWMASYEGQEVLVTEAHRQPIGPHPDLWDLYFSDLPFEKREYLNAWLSNILYGQNLAENFTYWETFPEMNRIMSEHILNIFDRHQPIQNELAAAARELRALLAEASE